MHQIKCVGILGWKKVSQLISRHGPARPRFRIIFVHFFTDMSNFVSFFAGRNAAGCPTEYFLWILNKRPAAGATCQCLDRHQKELIPSIWSPSKNRHYTFKQKHCVIFFYMFFNFCYFVDFCCTILNIFKRYFFVFCLFSVFFHFPFFRFFHFFCYFFVILFFIYLFF